MLALKFLWAPDPVAISLGSISIYYYSLMFVIAFVGGLYLMKYMYKIEGVSVTHLDPLLLYMVVGTLLGARLGEVFFYNWDYFQSLRGAAGPGAGRRRRGARAVLRVRGRQPRAMQRSISSTGVEGRKVSSRSATRSATTIASAPNQANSA